MILTVGSINQDIVLNTDEIPAPGETVMALDTECNAGGKGANQAVACSLCGSDVVMLGCVGNDAAGEFLLASMKNSNVDISKIKKENCKTSTAYICVSEKGENSIIVDSKANKCVGSSYLLSQEQQFEKAEYCILQREIPDESIHLAMQLCRKYNVKTVWNPSPVKGIHCEDLQGLYVLVPNEHEAQVLCGKPVDQMRDRDWIEFLDHYQIANLVLTLGSRGCMLVDINRNVEWIDAFPCTVVDTTGAGDTFLGALVARLAEGSSLTEAARFANAAGSLQCSRPGAQKAMPGRTEIENLLNNSNR